MDNGQLFIFTRKTGSRADLGPDHFTIPQQKALPAKR
jgi:hypothetical protein